MKATFYPKLINITLLFALCISIACAVLAYHLIQRLLEANKLVLHTHQVIETADHTWLSLLRVEGRTNLLLFTDNKNIIKVVPSIINEIEENLNKLKQLTRDNPSQQNKINYYANLVQQKVDLINQTLSAYATKGKAAALQIVAKPIHETLKENTAKSITEIIQEERLLLEKRKIAFEIETQNSEFMFIFTAGLSSILFIISLILLNHNQKLLNLAETEKDISEKQLIIANKLLNDTKRRYELALKGSNTGLWDWEVNTQNVFYSSNFLRMLGYDASEFPPLFSSFEKILHPDDTDRVLKSIEKHLKMNVPYNLEYRLKLKSGEYHWFQAIGQMISDKVGNVMHMSGSLIDIHERKRIQQRLTMQYELTQILANTDDLKAAAEKIVEAICKTLEWDISTLWMVNNEIKILNCVGYWQQSHIKSQTFKEITCNTKFPQGVGMPGQVWETGQPVWISDIWQDDTFLRAKQAKDAGMNSVVVFPIISQHKIVGVIECYSNEKLAFNQELFNMMIAIGFQIGGFVERKLTERKLRESEEYKTAILESASDSIITIDENGFIVSSNPQTTTIFGFKNDELLNQEVEKIIPHLSEVINSLVNQPATEYILMRSDGSLFTAEINVSEMAINLNRRFVIIIRDITERKKVEQMKNEFISIVSHELRTPLTSIRGSLGLILGGTVGEFSEKARKLLDIANNNCERLLFLINDILDIEKMETGKMNLHFRSVDIATLVREAIDANKAYGDKFAVKIKLAKSVSDIKIYVDPDRFIQVLTNLISNAVKFSPPQSEVTLSIVKQNQKVRVSVSDKGPGIDEEFKSRIFQKFSQADSSSTRTKSGSGLGLNITKILIEKMNGTIGFDSEKGQGTTFYVDLPIWSQSEKDIEEIDEHLPSKRQNRLLICEDDEAQAEYVNLLLQNSGFETDVAYSVSEAKQFLAKNNYRALLLDIILPDQDGISFIRELRNQEETSALPIIVISVMPKMGDSLLDGDAINIVDWLDKPLNFSKLLQAIGRIKSKKLDDDKPHVLHVEDDKDTRLIIKDLLEDYAHVTATTSIEETQEKMLQYNFDLIILDLVLLDGNGVELLPFFAKYNIPIVVYSAAELDQKYSKYVSQELIKSKTSNEKLLKIIKETLAVN